MGLNPFWLHKFGFKPLLGLEPMAPIRPQLLVSHANHSATETSLYVCMYVCMYALVHILQHTLYIHSFTHTTAQNAYRRYITHTHTMNWVLVNETPILIHG